LTKKNQSQKTLIPGAPVPVITVNALEKSLGKVLMGKKKEIERLGGDKEGLRRANKKNEYSLRKAIECEDYGGNTEGLLNENKNLIGRIRRRKGELVGKLAESEKATGKRCDEQIDVEAKLLIYRYGTFFF
jgi:hypothetical protein